VLCSRPQVVFIVTGEQGGGRRARVRPAAGPGDARSLIRSAQGRTRVVADRAAALAIAG
jgi:hypothetical protein